MTMTSQTFPQRPSQLPQRGNALSRACFQFLYQQQGWHVIGDIPNHPKAVAIVAPHSSNIDAWYGFIAMLALGVNLTILGKASLFSTPLAPLLKWIGVIPVERETAHGLTQQIVQHIQHQERIWIGLAPEGTRKSASSFRTGFYHIAHDAQIPIVIFALDYQAKAIRCLGDFFPTGDYAADLEQILQRYAGQFSAKRPEYLSKPLQMICKKT